MGVLDGQTVSQAVTNPAFINKNVDDTMPNKLGFNRAMSGSSIADIQAAVNRLYDATGASESADGTTYNAPASTIDDGDSHETALTKLADKFHPSTGHKHTGAAGDAPAISGDAILGVPLSQFVVQGSAISGVTGSSHNVTALMAGKSPSSGPTDAGVIVDAPYNRTFLTLNSLTDSIVDAVGNLVYGRLTESAGTWTLGFYSLVSGVETAYSFASSTNIRWFYRELFEPLDETPVYSPDFEIWYREIRTLAVTGSSKLFGDVTLVGSNGTSLSQSGQTISISSPSLATDVPEDVAASGALGSSPRAAREDHTHRGVTSINAGGDSIYGPVSIAASGDAVVGQDGSTVIIYVPPATPSGGGGGALRWVEGGNLGEEGGEPRPAPIPVTITGIDMYLFEEDQGQVLTATMIVPDSYVPGTQINMDLFIFSPDSSGTIIGQTETNLIRPGTDPYDTPAGQSSSTNSPLSLSGATVDVPLLTTCNLTTISGTIGGIGVQPGDILRVVFYATQSSGGSDITLIPDTTSVRFS